jgi:glutathione S-transferase
MKLYFSPLACSLATRIALYEAGADATFVEVDSKTKMTEEGIDFHTIHPLGLVPALEIEPGEILMENAAILQFVAERFPQARLAPEDARGRAHLQQWLSFIGTELHKAIYLPLLDKTASAEVKAYALAKAESRLGWLAQKLEGREFLLDHFTVADAYLFAVLNWSAVTPVDLKLWPAIRAYHTGLQNRASVTRAFAEERERYMRRADYLAREKAGLRAPRERGVMTTAEVIAKFNDAFQRHDPAILTDLVADDCVIENSQPAPDGSRHIGRDACLAVWQAIAKNPATRFDLETVEILGDRAIIHWRYLWGDDPKSSVRGINLMRVRDGSIVEGLGYVKGA